MNRSMPKSRQQFRKEQAIEASLRSELRAHGVTRHSQREKLMQKAASSRPADLPQSARAALAARRAADAAAIAMVERLQGGAL